MTKEETINLIAGRIIDEYRKHSYSIEDWNKIAASKIYSQWFEFYDQQTKELQQRVEQLQFELKAADSVNEQLKAKIDELESELTIQKRKG